MLPRSSALPFSFSYFRHPAGLVACRALVNANASYKFPAFRMWHYPHRVLLPVLLEVSCRPATGSPGNTSNVVGSRREGHCCSTRCTARYFVILDTFLEDTVRTGGNMSKIKGCDNWGHDRDFGWWNANPTQGVTRQPVENCRAAS
jgi:hypothetical protein